MQGLVCHESLLVQFATLLLIVTESGLAVSGPRYISFEDQRLGGPLLTERPLLFCGHFFWCVISR
jgi:hypothetical protein